MNFLDRFLISLSSAAVTAQETARRLEGRSQGCALPGVRGKMIGTALLGAQPKDLEISTTAWCS